MTLAQLEAILAERLGTRSEEAARVLRGALSLVAERLEAGESVKLSGFGTFEVRVRPPRRRKDPRDGRDIEVPARRGIVFRPSRRVVASVNRSAD
jgi:nucleoid DNA-binding protein